MTTAPLGFKRLMLSLQPGAPARGVSLAVTFAEMFGAELHALFLEDAGLRNLAQFPFAREIHAQGGAWSPIEPAQHSQALDLAADAARRLFAQAARSLSRRQFEVLRGGAAEALATVLRAGDIVVVGAPAPAERAAEPFASVLAAVFASQASVLLAPARERRGGGPVAAIALHPRDRAVEAAERIAAATGESFVVLHADPSWAARPAVLEPGVRLAVVTRGPTGDAIALAFAAARGVPVLSIGPGEADAVTRQTFGAPEEGERR